MKKRMKIAVSMLLICLTLLMVLPAAGETGKTTQEEDMPLLSGMFVATELVTQDQPWDQEDWNRAVGQLKDVGMDKLVLQYAVQYYSETYKVHYYVPGFETPIENANNRQQTIEYALNACRDNGMQMYLGLHLAEAQWFSAMDAGFRDVDENGSSQFLTESAAYSQKVFDDLWAQYGEAYGDVIAGWYLPYEFNNTVGAEARGRLVKDFYQPLTNHIKSVTPDKLILISPLIYPPMLTQPTDDMLQIWEDLCYDVWANTRVDIIAPQDGCGWESSVRENLPPYYEAMDRARQEAQSVRDAKGYGKAYAWNNPELYSMTGSNTMTMERFSENMKTLDAYVEEHVSFSLHSLVWFEEAKAGTNTTNQAFYSAYAYMAQHNALYQQTVPTPEGLKAEIRNGYDAVLSWNRTETGQEMPVAGYQIRRVDVSAPEEETIILRDVPQSTEDTVTFTDAQLEPGHTYRYTVYAYDGSGNLSDQPAVTEVSITADAVPVHVTDSTDQVDLTVSAYDLGSGVQISGEAAALTGGESVRFARAEDGSAAKYVLSLTGMNQPVACVYLLVDYSPAQGLFFPQKVEVLADGVLVDTLYPQQEYGSSLTGRVYLPISCGQAAEKLELVITQNQPYLQLAGLLPYAVDENVTAYDTPQENLVEGVPVTIIGYDAGQSFDPTSHFRGVDRLVLDYATGEIRTESNLYKGSYATDLLTRGTTDLPLVKWQNDGGLCRLPGKSPDSDRSVWLQTINLGASFDLTVELPAPQTIQGVSTEWLSDRDTAVFLPTYIEYYGVTREGVEQLMGTAYRPSEAQIDFTQPVSQDNCHRVDTFRYKVADAGETVYTKVIARVYVQYPANNHFVRALAVY